MAALSEDARVKATAPTAPMQHFYVDFIEGVPTTSLCGTRTVSTAVGHDPAAPRCVVCLDLHHPTKGSSDGR